MKDFIFSYSSSKFVSEILVYGNQFLFYINLGNINRGQFFKNYDYSRLYLYNDFCQLLYRFFKERFNNFFDFQGKNGLFDSFFEDVKIQLG